MWVEAATRGKGWVDGSVARGEGAERARRAKVTPFRAKTLLFLCPTKACTKSHFWLSSYNIPFLFHHSADTEAIAPTPLVKRISGFALGGCLCAHPTVLQLLTAPLAIRVEIPSSPLIQRQREPPLLASLHIALSWRTSSLSTLLREWQPLNIIHGLHSKPRRTTF